MEGIDFINEYNSECPYVTVVTSGSTGTPKTMQLDKTVLRESALRTNRFFNITSRSHLHSAISDQFIGGKMMIVRSIEANCLFTFEKPSLTPLKNHGDLPEIDLLAVVPSQMWALVSNEYEIPKIHNIIVGGAPVSDKLARLIHSQPFKAWETYGMTETASHIALKEISPGIDYFTTLPGVSLNLDERDCLEIKTPSLTVLTNDVAVLMNDSQFRILGRYDNMINSGGKKVNPKEIEDIIEIFTDAEFYVSSKKDELWGERIILALNTSSDGASQLINDWNGLKERLANHLPHWKIPKEIIPLPSFEKTENGKLKRQKF